MKKKKTYFFYLMFLFVIIIFTSCSQTPHEHSFSNLWTSNREGHWHQSTCSGHNPIKKDYASHYYDNNYTCTVCGYYDIERINQLFSIDSYGKIALKAKNKASIISTIVVPYEVNGIHVTGIADEAFFGASNIEQIILPESITSIGSHAFWGCEKLKTIEIPTSVTIISTGAFTQCDSLESIFIPASVSSIEYAFGYCDSLKSIEVDESNLSYSSADGNLLSKDGSTLIAVPAGKTGELRIDAAIVPIGSLSGCTKIEKIIISSSTTTIDPRVYNDCPSLTAIEVDPESSFFKSIDGCLYSSDSSILLYVPRLWEGEFIISEATTEIGDYAFAQCSLIESIVIPSSINKIGDFAFSGCKNLKDITIPDSVSSVGRSSFSGCSGISKLVFTNTQISFAYNLPGHEVLSCSFSGFSGEVVLPDGIDKIPSDVFFRSGSRFTIPDSVKTIQNGAFESWYGASELTIPEGVTYIEYDAFKNSSIEKITLPSSLRAIGTEAFYGCNTLAEISFNGTVSQWKSVGKSGYRHFDGVPTTTVKCSDGITTLL